MPAATHKRTTKGQRTRAKILDVALGLFREHGYEATTMRMIADEAGVSVGNAYYYFPSKEHLVQGFYGRLREEHTIAAEPILAQLTDLEQRLAGVLHALVDVAEPYWKLSGHLFRAAADPSSPLNPFSDESRATRARATQMMGEVLYGSTTRVPDDLDAEMPELLWLLQMAIVLFWIHDASPNRRRTRALIDKVSGIVARLIGLSGKAWMAPLRKQAVELLHQLRAEVQGAATESGESAGPDPAKSPETRG